MINPKEIRVGNYVCSYSEPNKKILLDSENLHEWLHTGADSEHFEPIRLTHELLIDLGFYVEFEDDKEYGKSFTFKIIIGDEEIELWYFDENKDDVYNLYYPDLIDLDIRYLHHLQNLLFDILGVELNLTLTPNP